MGLTSVTKKWTEVSTEGGRREKLRGREKEGEMQMQSARQDCIGKCAAASARAAACRRWLCAPRRARRNSNRDEPLVRGKDSAIVTKSDSIHVLGDVELDIYLKIC